MTPCETSISVDRLIQSRSRYYAELYNIRGVPLPIEEFVSRGRELCAEAITAYSPDRGASFPTYLFHRLGRLKDVAVAEQRRMLREVRVDWAADCIQIGMETPDPDTLCLDDLGDDARELVEHLISRGMRRGIRPTARSSAKLLGWPVDRAEDAWEEAGVWIAHHGRYVSRTELQAG